jgi:hypothetical protein
MSNTESDANFIDENFTVCSESRCALRLRYGMFQACIDARGHHLQHLL